MTSLAGTDMSCMFFTAGTENRHKENQVTWLDQVYVSYVPHTWSQAVQNMRDICLGLPKRLVVAEHRFKTGHSINSTNTFILDKVTG
jgi:hypothetical protein